MFDNDINHYAGLKKERPDRFQYKQVVSEDENMIKVESHMVKCVTWLLRDLF